MKTLTLQQGSPEWLAHRRTTRNASEAPVMMGACPSFPRREFVRLQAVGLEREFSDYVQKYILDRGHEVEPALRAMAEAIIGEDLYPVTGVSDDGYLSASFDGVTLGEDTLLEAKQWSAEKAACVERGEIPPQDYWQVVQQFAVCDSAERCLYLVGDGTEDGTVRMTIDRADIAHDIPKLMAGWEQFEADVAAYVPEAASAPAATGRAPDQLPALHIEVTGMVTASNLSEFKSHALAVLGSINRELQTDEDFANAEQTVKWCKAAEERLAATKDHVLGQTADIEAVFRTMDEVSAETRRIRLDLDKLVKAEKENRKAEIVQAGARSVREHYDTINATLGEHRMQPPQSLNLDLGMAIKGKKSISSMRDAVDACVANAKIAASQQAERVRANVAILAEHADHASLFADRVSLCASKAPEDLRNLVAARIAEHQQREAERLEKERERIRQEEVDRLEREQAATRLANSYAREIDEEDVRAGAAATVAEPDSRMASMVEHGMSGVDWSPSGKPRAPAASTARIKLGDINARIAPMTITADGLAQLGFRPVGTERAAKLYSAADFPAICDTLIGVLQAATQKKAA